MSDYVKSTDFASKDTLPSGDSAKIVRGTEIDAEFEALEVAIASKANTSDVSSTYAPLNSPTFTGSPVLPTGTTAVTQTAGDNDTSVATTAFVTTAVAALGYPAFKNRIINGAMMIDQRNAGAAVTPSTINAATYFLDRWNFYNTAASKLTYQQSNSVYPAGYAYSMAINVASAYSPTGSDAFSIEQPIEAFNVSDLNWGTANAVTVTVSFWVRSSLTGTFSGSLKNSAANRSYPFTFAISAANTWEYKTIIVPGDTTGTWVSGTNGIGLRLVFDTGCGANRGTANSWQASNLNGVTSAVQLVANAGATFYITGVQLEKGSTATSFDYRPYGTELMLCQRYYEVCDALFMNSAWSSIYNTIWWKATKRTMPTLVSIPGGGSGGTFNPAFGGPNTSGAFQDVANSISSGGTVKASAEL